MYYFLYVPRLISSIFEAKHGGVRTTTCGCVFQMIKHVWDRMYFIILFTYWSKIMSLLKINGKICFSQSFISIYFYFLVTMLAYKKRTKCGELQLCGSNSHFTSYASNLWMKGHRMKYCNFWYILWCFDRLGGNQIETTLMKHYEWWILSIRWIKVTSLFSIH